MDITLTNNIYINKYKNYKNYKNNCTNKYINNQNQINKDYFQKNPFITNIKADKSKYSFTGITRPLEQIPIKSAKDVITQWEKMKFAPYYEALDDKIYPQNKLIRMKNFSFLDNLTSSMKKEFVDYFEKFSNFPDLEAVASKIENEFITQVYSAVDKIAPGVKIIAAGYDPTCSVGLKKAFPGSDMDKAFVVLRNASNLSSIEVVNRFKGHFWFNTDQRILSLNNEDTFPEVYTMDQIHSTLNSLDKVANKLWFSDAVKTYMKKMQNYELDPIKGALFNIYLKQKLPSEDISKEYAKNFAYFIESVRDGKNLIRNRKYYDILYYAIDLSQFGQYSNVTQMSAHNKLLSSGEKQIKKKLQLREKLVQEYPKMNSDEKFELIKDIIKAVSKDNDNPKFEKYFSNDDNIKERYEHLNKLLLE